jgi:NTE family protein
MSTKDQDTNNNNSDTNNSDTNTDNTNTYNNNNTKYIDTFMFSGGAMKGIAYIGALKALDELHKSGVIDLNIKKIYAVSIGSMFAFLYALGYTYTELQNEVIWKDFNNLKNIKFDNFIKKYGLDSGKEIIGWIETLVIKKGYSKDITFGELYEQCGIDLQIFATNLNKYEQIAFNRIDHKTMKITKAIRMSIGIPLIFAIEKYRGDIYVDGGIINNYPIKTLKHDLDTFLGLKLVTIGEFDDHVISNKIDDISSYFSNLMSCYIIQKEKSTTLSNEYRSHTISIQTQHITNGLDYTMTTEQKMALIQTGYDSTKLFFEKR